MKHQNNETTTYISRTQDRVCVCVCLFPPSGLSICCVVSKYFRCVCVVVTSNIIFEWVGIQVIDYSRDHCNTKRTI